LLQLRQSEHELAELDIKVVVVTFQGGWQAEAYVEQTNLLWPILLDTDLTVYHAYGMERARWQDLWGLATWRVYLKLLWKGRRLRRSDADVAQLGGDVLVDPSGTVRIHHVGVGPADRPSVESILSVIRP
jgi:hypothetical protein